MNLPVLVLLGLAAWTLLTLVAGVDAYRWSRILTRRASIVEWRADAPQGNDWYKRAMRAHMNCVENLPVYGAVVLALIVAQVHSAVVDRLAVSMLIARIGQTFAHLVPHPTNASASLRFALFCIQLICMIAMGAVAVGALTN
jgi:uncharacterized MAPEG superfamily protein